MNKQTQQTQAISQSLKDDLVMSSFLKAQGLVNLLSFYARDDENLMTVYKGLEATKGGKNE